MTDAPTTPKPYFPPPRTRAEREQPTPYRTPAVLPPSAPPVGAVAERFAARSGPVVRATGSQTAAARHDGPATSGSADAELRREYVRSAFDGHWLFWGRRFGRALLVAYPRPCGLVLMAVGLVFLLLRVAGVGAPHPAIALLWGVGLVACEWLPLRRPGLRLFVAIASMVAAIYLGVTVEGALAPARGRAHATTSAAAR